ncbi:TetR/AcrR family transcriptional regulator [Roseiterribacter gracilis]|uniref:TetR family transcriptional regulator n=1 Tax=Roseiterribacter gracilis TaxID=2812848 RepID=A0A8S8XG79_9PROT|nr:TetR family transcriptional regulator [Rhodospirillales bacterium TMPK1]
MAVGRPRAFDKEKALDDALQVFLRKGYEGASLAELTDAMGINPPSLYAAFGNKEGLFRLALDRYTDAYSAVAEAAMAAPTAREATAIFLRGTIDSQTRKNGPGCLLVHGALACAESSDAIKQELTSRRSDNEAMLRARYVRAVKEGDLPAGTDTAALARYVSTMLQGTAVQAASGVARDELYDLIEMTLQAFPAAAPRKKKKG